MAPKRPRNSTVVSEPPRVFERQAKPPKVSEASDIVTVKIQSGEKYCIHAHLLVQFSEYFLRALNSGMSEVSSMEFELEEHADEAAMAILVDWVYEKLYCVQSRIPKGIYNMSESGEHWAVIAYQAWQLADYLQMAELQNDLMRKLFEGKRTFKLHPDFFTDISHTLPAISPLFKFHCMIIAARLNPNPRTENTNRRFLQGMGPDVISEVAIILLKGRENILQRYDLSDFLIPIA